MASGQTDQQGSGCGTSSPNLPDETHDRGAPDTDPQGSQLRARGPAQADDAEERSDSGRRELAIPTVVPSAEETCDIIAVSSDTKGLGKSSDGIGRSLAGSHGHCAISCAEEPGSSDQSGTMATEDGHQGHGHIWHPEIPGSQQHVAGPGHNNEVSFPKTAPSVPTDSGTCSTLRLQEGQGQGQRQAGSPLRGATTDPDLSVADQIRSKMVTLALGNDHNWCFANAATLAFLWATLGKVGFQLTDWGQHASSLLSLLTSGEGSVVKLVQQPFFLTLFERWHFLARPQDAAEYTGFLLESLGLSNLQQCWERRLLENDQPKMFDFFRVFQPLHLQFPTDAPSHAYFSLNSLIALWHEDHGMKAALTAESPLLCVHVDRAGQDELGQIMKLRHRVNFFQEVRIPFFTASDLMCTFHSYVVIAVVAHLGDDLSTGHYQALLKAQVNEECTMGTQWFLADDNVAMRACFAEVDHFVENATLLWLCRHDCVHLFQRFPMTSFIQAKAVTPARHDTTEVLRYF